MRLRLRMLVLGCAVMALVGLGTGCGTKPPALKFTSDDKSKVLQQPFGLAAMARDSRGDYDLVLMSQGLERLRSEEAGKSLEPSKDSPVRQVVHMKIQWRPRAGTQANNPASANASVRWVIFGTPGGAGDDDVIEYQGTAFVRPVFEDGGYTLKIRKGDVQPARLVGEMVDVMGPTMFEGEFYVRDDAYTVQSVLKELPPAVMVAPPPKPPSMGAVTRAAAQRAKKEEAK